MNEQSEANSEAQSEITELEHYIEDLWKFFPTPLAYANPLGIIMDADQALLDLFGYSKEELIGRSFYELSPAPEELKKLIKLTLSQGLVVDQEIGLTDKAGALFQANISAMARKNAENDIFGLFVSIIDLSRSKRAQRQLEILNRIVLLGNKVSSPDALLAEAMTMVLKLMRFDGGGAYLVDPDGKQATLRCSSGLPAEFVSEVRLVNLNEPSYAAVLVKGVPLFQDQYALLRAERAKKYGFTSIASVPLWAGGKVSGSLNIVNRAQHAFSSEEKELLLAIARELSGILTRLLAEEAVRTRAAELEKMNRFMIGREVDMIELKKEVNGLLGEMGRKSKYRT
ncbi:MAG: GAF domain-containing protein [Candidatus Margulisiibacteriota bacterium]